MSDEEDFVRRVAVRVGWTLSYLVFLAVTVALVTLAAILAGVAP